MQMSSRTAKFLPAVFASVLLGTPLATLAQNAARTADNCLAGPKKDHTPQGSHWYYRIEHPSNRHCWYLGDEREKLSQTTAPKPSQSAQSDSPKAEPPDSPGAEQPPSPRAETTMQPSIADAHAELPLQTRVEPQTRVDTPNGDGAFAAAVPASPAIRQDSREIIGADTGRSVVASRWPDSSADDPSPASDPAPNRRDAVASASAAPQIQPAIQATEQLAAADAASETSTYSVPMQLAAALMAALALAGIIASVIFRFGRSWHPAEAKIRQRRAQGWEPTDDDGILLSAEPGADVLPHPRDFAREFDRDGDRGERITEFFAQLSKRR
jgi:hypothetical protein